MRRTEKDITDSSELHDILKRGRVCRVGMTDKGQPYVVPLNFGYEDGKLYFHSSAETGKIDVLKTNPQVCFEVTIEEELPKTKEPNINMRIKSVIGSGQAKFIEDRDGKTQGLKAIIKHYDHDNAEHNLTDEMLSRLHVVEVAIENMTGKQLG